MTMSELPTKCQTCKNVRSWHTKDDEITYGCDKKTIPLYAAEEIEACKSYLSNI